MLQVNDELGLTSLLNVPVEGELAMDSMGNTFDAVRGMVGFIKKAFKTNALIPSQLDTHEGKKALALIESVGASALKQYGVVIPDGMSGDIDSYYHTLGDIMTELASINTRLLDPLKLWASHVVSDPDSYGKAWLNNHVVTIDTDKLIKKLKRHIRVGGDDGTTVAKFHETFGSVDAFKKSMVTVTTITKQSVDILGMDINKSVEELAEVLTLVTNDFSSPNSSLASNKPLVRIISDTLYEAAKEVELLAVVLFKVKVGTVVADKNIAKILKDLK